MSNPRFDQRVLGASGEDRAARWYAERGYEVLARNWRCREGEVDLILTIDQVVVFCEVKTRSSDRFGTPFEAVGWRKQAKLRRLASIWLANEAAWRPAKVRFDVAAVVGTKVEVRESAF